MRYARYVALGDSTTEGLMDPAPGGGWRGWADRLAERLAGLEPGLLYANLAVRGRKTRQVREQQLPVALGLAPDLASVVCGLNDLLRRHVDLDAVLADLEAMQAALGGRGATVLAATLPDLSSFMPVARPVRGRLRALNAGIREMAGRTGALVLDLDATPVAADPRVWSPDRLHANAEGHARIAAGFAELLGLPGADHAWAAPLGVPPARGRREALAIELAWSRAHFAPWLLRRMRGRSSGDGIVAKRPQPRGVLPPDEP